MTQLCVITDTVIQNRFTHLELAEQAIRGGADMIQCREKRNLPSKQLLEIALAMNKLCQAKNIPLIINDRVDIALLSDAAGVHLGEDDLPVQEARKILGPSKIIGAGAGSLERALELEQEGADYIGFGHLFPTQSKAKTGPPKSISELKKICQSVKIPVIAIGGITASNVREALEANPHGIAVIGAVCGAENPETATQQLKAALQPCVLP